MEVEEREQVCADVVVVGTGPAGMAAVSAARAEGATVAAVETLPQIGGNARLSNGYLAFVGSPMQVEHGIVDDEKALLTDARRMVADCSDRYGIELDEELVRVFARESPGMYELLVARGARFTRIVPRPEQHTVDRMLEIENGQMFTEVFAPDFADPAVRVLCDTVASRLVTDDGRVVGVLGDRADGGGLTVRASGGVVLATGGYQANPLLRKRYQPEGRSHAPYMGLAQCQGIGHLIGQAVGADLMNMTVLPPMVVAASAIVENSVAVNIAGHRFHDEVSAFEERVDRLREQPDQRAWYIMDDVATREQARLLKQMPEPPIRADSIAELATLIGVPGAALEWTIRRWNDFLATDLTVEPDFGRWALPRQRHGCLVPPFIAAPMIEGVSYSRGGFRTTPGMQVVDVFGAPIPGLYAAGDCAAGLIAAADLGGLHISSALTLGRVAGRSAARHVPDATDYGSVVDISPAPVARRQPVAT